MKETVSVTLKGVSKSFRARNGKPSLQVLKDISLDIRKGEFLCIVGPSGCGKTTLLNIVAGLGRKSSGEVLHNGIEVSDVSADRVVIFQDLGLFPWLTVQKNVEFGLKMKGIPADKRRKAADQYIDMVHLTKFKDAYIHELSGGMKQRVALARALAIDPEILLMDEPFSSLDAQTRDNLHLELQKIWAKTKKTIIFVTHNVREAVCLGDRVIVFSAHPGRMKASFDVDLPRPRNLEDHRLVDMVKLILAELRFEIDRSFKEEFNAKKTG